MSGSTTEGVYAELYVRSLAPRGVRTCQDDVVGTLRELRDRGDFEFTVRVCGARAPATQSDADTDVGADLLDRVAAFERWADRNGCSLGSLFERRTVESSITGETHETLVLPAMVLAEYVGDDLRFVAPCVVDGALWTVQRRLEALLEGPDRPAPAGTVPLESVRRQRGEGLRLLEP